MYRSKRLRVCNALINPLIRVGPGKLDHLGPLLSLFGRELVELGRRARKRAGAGVGEARAHVAITFGAYKQDQGRADPPSDSSDWAITRTGRLTTGRASWILARKRDLVLIPPEGAEWHPLLHRLKSFAPVKIHDITVSSHTGGGNTCG